MSNIDDGRRVYWRQGSFCAGYKVCLPTEVGPVQKNGVGMVRGVIRGINGEVSVIRVV